MLSTLAPARRRLVLISAVLMLFIAAAAGFVLIRSHAKTATAAAQDKPGTVLLVPGYGGSTSALTVLAAALARHGRTAHVVDLPDGGIGDLRAQAKALNSAADEAIKQSGVASVDIVGYSAGGVTARLWVKSYGGAAKARRVVTLGSPQHGTELASAGAALPAACPVACQQLTPDSDLLAQLNQGSETPAGPQFVAIWSDVDHTVVPPQSARLTGSIGMSIQSICPASRVAHANLPRDPVITAITIAELDGPTATQFGAGDCQRLSS